MPSAPLYFYIHTYVCIYIFIDKCVMYVCLDIPIDVHGRVHVHTSACTLVAPAVRHAWRLHGRVPSEWCTPSQMGNGVARSCALARRGGKAEASHLAHSHLAHSHLAHSHLADSHLEGDRSECAQAPT